MATKVSKVVGVGILYLTVGLLAGAGSAVINGFQYATGNGRGIWMLPYVFFVGVVGLTSGIVFATTQSPSRTRRVVLCVAVCCIVGLVLWSYINHKIGVGFVHP